tara:strand:+ start:376 stop:1161 length:786 start_codon:yes stop_codon:yes gene_type:complete
MENVYYVKNWPEWLKLVLIKPLPRFATFQKLTVENDNSYVPDDAVDCLCGSIPVGSSIDMAQKTTAVPHLKKVIESIPEDKEFIVFYEALTLDGKISNEDYIISKNDLPETVKTRSDLTEYIKTFKVIEEEPEWLKDPPPIIELPEPPPVVSSPLKVNISTTKIKQGENVVYELIGILPPRLLRSLSYQKVTLLDTNGNSIYMYGNSKIVRLGQYTVDVSSYEDKTSTYVVINKLSTRVRKLYNQTTRVISSYKRFHHQRR